MIRSVVYGSYFQEASLVKLWSRLARQPLHCKSFGSRLGFGGGGGVRYWRQLQATTCSYLLRMSVGLKT